MEGRRPVERREDESDGDHDYAHISSEPESLHRHQLDAAVRPRQNYDNVAFQGRAIPQEREALMHEDAHPAAAQGYEAPVNLYNFKGFVLFCFGTPGITPQWCSFIMLLYYMILFSVGIALAVLALIGLTSKCSTREWHVFPDTLSLLSGLLFLLAVMNGGCTWAWRSVLPRTCTRSFVPVVVIAFVLSLLHVGLLATLSSLLIISKYTNNNRNCGADVAEWLENSDYRIIWTISALGLWAVCFVLALFPATILFCRKYRPRGRQEQDPE